VTVAFALSGGGNLGPMQAGAVAALLETGITPDLLVGTSVGALNATFLSSRPGLAGARSLMDAWATLRRHEVASFSPIDLLAGFFGARDHLLAASRLRALIRKWVEIKALEDAKTSVVVVATDALSGEAVVLQSGDVLEAVSASAAIPGLLPSVRMGDRWLIDGSLSAGCPVLQAQNLGADDVYMITTATAPRVRPPRGAVAMAMNSVSLVTARSNQAQLEVARLHASQCGGRVFVVPSGEPPAPGPFDLSRSKALTKTSYDATKMWLASADGDLEPHDQPFTADSRPQSTFSAAD
jgi:NTE family protein